MNILSKMKSKTKFLYFWFSVLNKSTKSFAIIVISCISLFIILSLIFNVLTYYIEIIFCFLKSDAFAVILTFLTVVGMVWGLYGLRSYYHFWIKKIRYRIISEYTYHHYSVSKSKSLIEKYISVPLAKRYDCEPLNFFGELIPSTIIWDYSKIDFNIKPNEVLDNFEIDSEPVPFTKSINLDTKKYKKARDYIKDTLENKYDKFGTRVENTKIKGEAIDYRMIGIKTDGNIPKITGKFGFYYDNLLTQYALEWELRKTLSGTNVNNLGKRLKFNLPLRNMIENTVENPLYNGSNRCAVISFSTLIVFKRKDEYYTIINKRSSDVAVSPNMYHVVPAGMFEAENTFDNWDLESNILREILEEVYDDKSHMNPGERIFPEYIDGYAPIPKIKEMLMNGSAELCVTGICVDLLNLRPEICTILFVDNEDFFKLKEIKFNWEYTKDNQQGKGVIPIKHINKFIERKMINPGFVVSGASCLALGLDWLESYHSNVFVKNDG